MYNIYMEKGKEQTVLNVLIVYKLLCQKIRFQSMGDQLVLPLQFGAFLQFSLQLNDNNKSQN